MYTPAEPTKDNPEYVDRLNLKEGQLSQIQEALDYSKTHVCPNCGYCPCCGRKNPTVPYYPPWPGYPEPYIGDYPIWPNYPLPQIWCTSGSIQSTTDEHTLS